MKIGDGGGGGKGQVGGGVQMYQPPSSATAGLSHFMPSLMSAWATCQVNGFTCKTTGFQIQYKINSILMERHSPCSHTCQSPAYTAHSPLHTHLSVPSIHTCQSPAYTPVSPLCPHLSVPSIHTCQSLAYTPVSPLYPHLSVPCTHIS